MSYKIKWSADAETHKKDISQEHYDLIADRIKRLSANPRDSSVTKAQRGGYTTQVEDTDLYFDIIADEIIIKALEERAEMGGYVVRFSPSAQKAYEAMPSNIKIRIDEKIGYLQQTPRGMDTIKLAGLSNAYRTRVGDYRIVFEIQDRELIVWILNIAHRSVVYR